jgi:hypothetical protein
MLDMTAGGTPTDEPPLINLILEPPPGALQLLDRGYAYFRGLWSFEFPSKPNLLEGSKPLEGSSCIPGSIDAPGSQRRMGESYGGSQGGNTGVRLE